MKNARATGIDDMCVEQIKQFDQKLFRETYKIPRFWTRSKVVAPLKPGKHPKNQRLISLLCSPIQTVRETNPEPHSKHRGLDAYAATSWVQTWKIMYQSNLETTEHIEKGYENKQITDQL